MANLRVMTLNLWNYSEPFIERQDVLIKYLSDEVIDVLMLQEVSSRHVDGGLFAFLKSSGYFTYFLPTGTWDGKEQGVAICVRGWSALVAACLMPSSTKDMTRGYLIVRYLLGEQYVYLCTTHLAYRPEDEQVRVEQVSAIAKALELVQSSLGRRPVLIGADLNCQRGDRPVELLKEGCSKAPLVDIQEAAGQGEQLTFSSTNPYCSPDLWPDRRIDFLLCDSSLRIAEFQILFDGESPYGYASDHFGLVASIGNQE